MFRKLARRPLSANYEKSTFSTTPETPEQNVASIDQASLNLNMAVPAVKGFFPLNEPAVGSAYTNTVCSPPGQQCFRVDCRRLLGPFHTKQGTPDVVPATYNQKCHFQEQDLGGTFTRIFFADGPTTSRKSPMCQYSADRGHATDWHLVHLGVRTSDGPAASTLIFFLPGFCLPWCWSHHSRSYGSCSRRSHIPRRYGGYDSH